MAHAEVKRRDPEATRAALVAAAAAEFEEFGFDDTNTNRIAQRAGYAPQTFYRHFEEKTDVFLAVYGAWISDELTRLDGVRDAEAAARTLAAHHRKSLNMRRALRTLGVADPRVRAARAESRLAQITRLKARFAHLGAAPAAQLGADLLTIERLADAIAEGELADLGVSRVDALAALARRIRESFGKRRGSA